MCLLVRHVVGKANSWTIPQLPTGTHFAWNELDPAAFQPAGSPWGTAASNHSLNIKLSLGQAQGKLERCAGRCSDEHKAGTADFPMGLCRWQINEDGLRGLSLMRLWRWKVCRWKNKYFQHPSCSFSSSRSLWERGTQEDVGDQGSHNPHKHR